MDKERNNDTLDINAKYKDMMYVSKRIVEHHEFVTDGSCEPPIFVCLAYDVKNYLPKLLEENEELKKQLETKHDGFMASVEESCDLAKENEKLKERLKATKEVVEEHLKNEIYLKNKQKEFIDYLETEKNRLARECSQIYENGFGRVRLVSEDVHDEISRILEKYRSIIGCDKSE